MQEARNLRKGINLEVATDSDIKSESSILKRAALWGTILVLMFLLGFIPAWWSARETTRQRDAAQANLRLSQLQNRLATAALSARRGEYEPARLATSDFFTDLRAEIDRPESGFNARQREAVQPILNERDEVITLLARYDRSAAERLTDMYLKYVQTMNLSAKRAE
jgi:hypothetical protein